MMRNKKIDDSTSIGEKLLYPYYCDILPAIFTSLLDGQTASKAGPTL